MRRCKNFPVTSVVIDHSYANTKWFTKVVSSAFTLSCSLQFAVTSFPLLSTALSSYEIRRKCRDMLRCGTLTDVFFMWCTLLQYYIQASFSYYVHPGLDGVPEMPPVEMHFLKIWNKKIKQSTTPFLVPPPSTCFFCGQQHLWAEAENYLWASALEYISSDTWHQAL